MDNMSHGSIIQQGNLLRVDNALVEEVSCSRNQEGHILISYSAPEENGTGSVQTIRLNLTGNTIVLDSFGRTICQCCIRKGMRINAVFSAQMTRSIPPQSNAFLIAVQRRSQNMLEVTTGRIAFYDADNRALYTGNANDPNSQTRFILSDNTLITDRLGRPVGVRALRPGRQVRIIHANFQTASIPPQTTAFLIQLL